jgi:hypothetical protein
MKTEYPAQLSPAQRLRRWLGATLAVLLTLALFVAPGGAPPVDPGGRALPAAACNGSGGGCG